MDTCINEKPCVSLPEGRLYFVSLTLTQPCQDNYTAAVGTGEVVTGEERQETVDFIEAIMATPCMRYAHAYLVSKGQAPESETDFKAC